METAEDFLFWFIFLLIGEETFLKAVSLTGMTFKI